jgi:hypothetical protein
LRHPYFAMPGLYRAAACRPTTPFNILPAGAVEYRLVFMNDARTTLPGATGHHHRVTQCKFVTACGTTLAVEMVKPFKIHDESLLVSLHVDLLMGSNIAWLRRYRNTFHMPKTKALQAAVNAHSLRMVTVCQFSLFPATNGQGDAAFSGLRGIGPSPSVALGTMIEFQKVV